MAITSGKRKINALALDEAILDAAVHVIGQQGPDGLNLSLVARTANASTGALYSRYENREELLVDVWIRRCAQPMRDLLSLSVEASKGNLQAANEAANKLDSTDSRFKVGFALLVVSPRVDELAEVIPQDLRSWFGDDSAWSEALMAVAFTLGAVGFNTILNAPIKAWGWRLKWASTIRLVRPTKSVQVPQVSSSSFAQLIQAQSGDTVRDKLLVAMSSVVARSGLSRTTTARIARAAGYPQSAIFSLWPTRADLVSDWAPTVMNGLVRSTSLRLGQDAPQGNANAAAGGLAEVLGPGYKLARRMRLEIILAGMTDPIIAKAITDSDEVSVSTLEGQFKGKGPLIEAVRVLVLGFVVLEEVVGGMNEYNLAEPIRSLLDAELTLG